MKKKLLIAIFILIIFLILYSIFCFGYTILIKKNWGVYVPKHDEQIYCKEDVKYGEGWKYNVLKYNNKDKIAQLLKIDWIYDKNKEIEEKTSEIIERLSIEEQYIIDFSKDYYYFYKLDEKDKRDFILLFYYVESNILYIIEQEI